jgi:hypothetical protein
VNEDFYHDDPIEEISKKSLRSKFLSTGVVIVGSIFFLQSTLAGNISLNSGRGIEFGQSVSQAVACSGNTELTLTPRSTFINGSPGAHYLQSVTVSNIPTSCYGDDFTINAFNDSSSTPLALFNSTATNAVVYNNNGSFQKGIGISGLTVSSGSGSFTVTFTNPVAQSSSVFKFTIQSSVGNKPVWTSRTSGADLTWESVAYGNGIFVAVAESNEVNGVMTSPDGITWTQRVPATNQYWSDVTFGNGIFVAVKIDGVLSAQVMTSSDGITWTSRTSARANSWRDVTYGNGLFVAVADGGFGDRVMTSPNGITWTWRTSAADNTWYGVTYGNGIFVAVASSGSNRVMTSPDGITWTARTAAAANQWLSVTYGEGVFVAVSTDGVNPVMTSPNGINWTSRSAVGSNEWRDVTYGNGLFVAVASSGSGTRVMTSPDGITWTPDNAAAANAWRSVTYGNGIFVAVSASGVGNRVMTMPY